MKRLLALTQAVLLSSSLLLTGCGSDDQTETLPPLPTVETSFNVQIGATPTTLDPAFAFYTDEQTVLNHLYEGLVTLDANNQPQPGVATSWERAQNVAGEVTYTFTLDENAVWNDGTPVTAYDFIYSWERTLSPDTNSPLAYQLFTIKNAQVINADQYKMLSLLPTEDESEEEIPGSISLGITVNENANTMSVTLAGDSDSFLQNLALPAFAPLQHQSNLYSNSNTWYKDTISFVGNGPYVLTSWIGDQNLLLSKSETYVGGRNRTHDQINFVFATTEQTEQVWADFANNTLNVVKDIPLSNWDLVKNGESETPSTVKNVTVGGTATLLFNLNKTTFNDPNVNKTLSQAINRDDFAAHMRNHSVPATALVPPNFTSDDNEYRQVAGDLSTVTYSETPLSTLLGMPTITLLTTDSAAHITAAEYLVSTWQEQLGLTVNIQSVGWTAFMNNLQTGNFDFAYYPMYGDNFSPHSFLDIWVTNHQLNYASYANEEYDTYIALSHGLIPELLTQTDDAADETAEETVDAEEDQELTLEPSSSPTWQHLIEAERLLVDEKAAIVPLTWYADSYALQPSVTTFAANTFGILYFG